LVSVKTVVETMCEGGVKGGGESRRSSGSGQNTQCL